MDKKFLDIQNKMYYIMCMFKKAHLKGKNYEKLKQLKQHAS